MTLELERNSSLCVYAALSQASINFLNEEAFDQACEVAILLQNGMRP